MDQLDLQSMAHESKVGYTQYDDATALQVAKDAELLKTDAVKGLTWHFFTSPVTGLGGPSPSLLKALNDANITVVMH